MKIMKTRKGSALLILLLIFAFAVYAGDKKSSYSGTWKLDKVKTPPAGGQIFLAQISFTLKNDSLITARTYENANGETYPFNETLTMDGKEYKIIIYDMPRTAKAYWSEPEGMLVIESTTTFTRNSGEENLLSNETWKVDESGKTVTINFVSKMTAGEFKGSYTFTKAE